MSVDVVMPQLGETVAEGKILAWMKAVGDEVKVGDRLFEVETDKVTIDVESIAAGRLTEIRIGNGVTAKVGTVVAIIGETGAATGTAASVPAAPGPASGSPASGTPSAPAATLPRTLSPFAEVQTPTANYGKAEGPGGVRLSPLARRFLVENGIDPAAAARLAETKGARRLSVRDLRDADLGPAAAPALQAQAAPPQHAAPQPAKAPVPVATTPVTAGSTQVITLSGVRAKTGERLAENWRTIPHVFQAIEVDFTEVETVRARQKEAFRAETGASLTYLPFIARATCLALQAFPMVNARLDGQTLTVPADIHLGIAVDLNFNGLVVPVVRNAGDLTLPGLAKAINRQVEKARTGRLAPDDMTGGTYSITNNGAFGTSFTAPIINAPQVAILSTDAIRKRPAVVSTAHGDFVVPRLTGMVGQSFDHRAFDGAYSAAFLSRLKDIIETRDWTSEFPARA